MNKYRIVPVEPTEAQWSGLARYLMMWLDMGDKTPQGLFKHLKMLGIEPPRWLQDEAEMQGSGVPSKGTRATLIYKAMLAAAPSPWISVEDRLPDVPEGDHAELIVCVRRGHNGKVYVFAARYLNKYPLYSEHHEDADEDGMLLSTGWYDVKQHYEYDEWYSELIDPSSGDAVTHWMPLPEAPEVSA